MTTRVNYGDWPAGCIATAAVQETATRFGEGKERAAWFLKNRMYVDDATGGASSMEAAKQVSQEMEDILGNGGFRFKETVISGDPLGKDRELRKVLRLRWDTQQDEICVDIKLNYGEKVKGAYLEEDAPLTDPESALPQVITRRVLWRVAQSQYDLLGLLSVYMVKWKLLMRKMTLKGKEGGWESPLDKEEEEEFRQLLRDLKELREIRFPRCMQPLEGQFARPMLMGVRRRFTGGLLYISLPTMGKGRRHGSMPSNHGEETGCPKGEDNHPEDGASGGGQLRQAS